MNPQKLTIIIILVFSIITLSLSQDNSADLRKLLAQIKTYEYGQSLENFTAINNIMRNIGNSDEQQKEAETMLIEFLESTASLPAKRFVCECLSIYGSDESVPVLEELLSESETESMALFALERISSDDAAEVLIDALSGAKGTLKVDIINALGHRREENALEDIIPMINDKDETVAYAAISAVGRTGGDKAAEALKAAMSDTDNRFSADIINAYLKCAESYSVQGEKQKALKIYQSLENSQYNNHVRYAALKGIIKNSDQSGTDVIVSFFENENADQHLIAIALVTEIPLSEDVTPIVKSMSKMKSEDQMRLLSALAGRKEKSVVNMMVKMTDNTDEQIRLAALEALSLSGDSDTALLFAQIAAVGKAPEKTVARAGLDRLNAPGADELIVNSISQAADPLKIELIRCTAPRYITTAAPLLVYELENTNDKVRVAAIKALKEIGSSEQLDPLITYHMKTKNEKEMKSLEGTIVAICNRLPDTQSQAAPLLNKYDKIKDSRTKTSYLEMMGKIGDPKSLNVLNSALKDKNDDIKTSAIRGLSDWPDMKPADELLTIAKTSTNEIHQTLALRGYLNLLGHDKGLEPPDKFGKYKEAMDLAAGVAEKKQILSGIARIRNKEAFEFAAQYLDDVALKSEAEMAVLRIGRQLGRDQIDLTLPVVKKVRAQTDNEEIKEEIDELLEEIEKDQ